MFLSLSLYSVLEDLMMACTYFINVFVMNSSSRGNQWLVGATRSMPDFCRIDSFSDSF